MELTNWFATPIWTEWLDVDLNKIREHCFELQRLSPGRVLSNRGGWQSSNIVLSEHPEFFELEQKLLEAIKSMAFDVQNDLRLRLDNVWININNKNNYNEKHVHPVSAFSGVFYVCANENSGNIKFSVASSIEHYPVSLTNPKIIHNSVELAPQPGKLLLFPSWLHHEVLPSHDEETRISIAFNTQQVH
jgi:uncharacterized protein (TIGR02466 family)